MIGRLTGTICALDDDSLIIDVGGVGYQLRATQSLQALAGQHVTAFIETVVRDEQIMLYGFLHAQERVLFRLLVSVQGVGANLAMRLLSSLGLSTLVGALQRGDERILSSVSGIGARVARRLCNELPSIDALDALGTLPSGQGETHVDGYGDALMALESLGYGRREAAAALQTIDTSGDKAVPLAEVVKQALRVLAS
ncbi:MAG: Holliday junction branch migration protein RuvA [Alphaproteobacteria bacterium GM202ARS2]|nr:Holliday junction branch migration protein RuvA [Alphaproteobacteria bacterium GM202ARS2]